MAGFAGRDLVSINDFSNEEIEALLDLADDMNSALAKGREIDLCRGKDLATLFYEPSTRTRGSFERAMHKLGGDVLSFAEAATGSSAAKGETLTDTVRVLENYADIIALRHPLEGAARVAADYARVPVINAGDGAHEHPTQTLCDLYTMRKQKGKIKGLTVCLRGDLRYGRTVHSLIYALARFGAEVLCWPPTQELDMPDVVLKKLRAEYNYAPRKVQAADMKSLVGEVDVLYITPLKPYTFSLWPESGGEAGEVNVRDALKKTDVIYVTRLQTERQAKTGDAAPRDYFVLNRALLEEFKRRPMVMHPLPRVNELSYELDQYPQSMYFQQAAYGVPVRMALMALLLGATEISVPGTAEPGGVAHLEKYHAAHGVVCPNVNCISNNEREKRYILGRFDVLKGRPLTLRCVYCEHEVQPAYIASSDWHEGKIEGKRYHRADSHWLDRIKPENLIIFGSEGEARAHGYQPSRFARARESA